MACVHLIREIPRHPRFLIPVGRRFSARYDCGLTTNNADPSKSATMKNNYAAILLAMFLLPQFAAAQDTPKDTIEINGNWHPAEVTKLERIWLYPEDYEGKTVILRGFLFKAENFEYFPEHDGYLFCCEPAVFGRNLSVHALIGNATFVSREKLNFLCTKADGQLVRKLFKESARDLPVSGDFVIEIKKRNDIYFGLVTSFTHRGTSAARR
jgi:hypothetical protein